MNDSRQSSGQQVGSLYRFAACELDPVQREIRVQGQALEIQPKVFDLLLYLIEQRARVVDRDELLDVLWPGTVVTESALSQAVRKARAVVGPRHSPATQVWRHHALTQ